ETRAGRATRRADRLGPVTANRGRRVGLARWPHPRVAGVGRSPRRRRADGGAGARGRASPRPGRPLSAPRCAARRCRGGRPRAAGRSDRAPPARSPRLAPRGNGSDARQGRRSQPGRRLREAHRRGSGRVLAIRPARLELSPGGAGWTRMRAGGYLGVVGEARLAAMIEDLTRRVTGAAPAPRGLPYLGLETPSGSGVQLLEALSAHGIFRKYELVLDLGGGAGSTARWLGGRLGCTAVATTDDAAVAVGGRALTRRASLSGHVHHVCAEPGALPFGNARFTHVWFVETLPRMRD